MKIAVISKKNIADNPLKKWLLDGIKSDGSFDVKELETTKDISASFDKVLVFGGDGTMLDAVRHAVIFDIPVLGVNLGNLGFLTEFDKDATANEIIMALKSEDYTEKSLIDIIYSGRVYVALNELVLKSTSTRPGVFDLYIDDNFADTFKSDGLMVATPTGSTAYALAAGGPVLSPSVEALVIIPICPHTLHSRPIVVSDKSKVSVRISGELGDVALIADGNTIGTADVGEEIVINKADKTAKFVVGKNENFYNKLLKKMNVWSTTLQKTE